MVCICITLVLLLGFPGGSEGKVSDYNTGGPGFDPWVGKIPWRRKWQSTPGLLPGKSHGQRRLVSYSPWGCRELDTTERLHFFLSRLVIAFLLRSKCFFNLWCQHLWSPSAVILEPKKIKFLTASFVSPPICYEVMGLDAIS